MWVNSIAQVEGALQAIADGATAESVESAILEFKSQGRSRDDTSKLIAEAVACFANAAGGHVVLGVRNRPGGPEAFEGTSIDPDILLRRIYELTTPPLTVEVDPLVRGGVTLLIVRVPRSPDVHQVDGRATRRIGASCESMSAAQIAALLAERRGDDWSGEDTGRPLTDVSATAVEQARALLRAARDPARRAYAGGTTEDLLRALGVTTSRNTLIRAGELLLCEPSGPIPSVVYQYRRTPAGEPVTTRPEGSLLSVFLRTLELISGRLDTTPVNLPGGQQIQLADLPEPAIREAVANAVMHRDYRLTGSVQIEHAATRLAVTSPGPLVQGVTLANILTTSSRPRNARLAAAVRTLGLAEEAGVGVDRMYREMVRVGFGPPVFEETAHYVRVTLTGGAPSTHLTRFVATLPQVESEDADAMLTLYTLLTRQVVSARQLAPLLQKEEPEVEYVLRRLATEPSNIIEPTRESADRRHRNYRLRDHVISALGPAVNYRRRTSDEYDRTVIGLVREMGQINAAVVRMALGLPAQRASRILSHLVERGVLVRTSEAQRGRGVTYGPGPLFPPLERKRARQRPS